MTDPYGNHMTTDKWLLVKGIAGLGDRIQCVLTAILYARPDGTAIDRRLDRSLLLK